MCVHSDLLNYKGIEHREVYIIECTFQTRPLLIKKKKTRKLQSNYIE